MGKKSEALSVDIFAICLVLAGANDIGNASLAENKYNIQRGFKSLLRTEINLSGVINGDMTLFKISNNNSIFKISSKPGLEKYGRLMGYLNLNMLPQRTTLEKKISFYDLRGIFLVITGFIMQ